VPRVAARISFVVASGCDSMATCDELTSTVTAWACFAMKRSLAGEIAWSRACFGEREVAVVIGLGDVHVSVGRPRAREVCAIASVRSRRRDAAFEQLFELLLVYRHLLGSLPARQDCKQLADAVTLEVELEGHA